MGAASVPIFVLVGTVPKFLGSLISTCYCSLNFIETWFLTQYSLPMKVFPPAVFNMFKAVNTRLTSSLSHRRNKLALITALHFPGFSPPQQRVATNLHFASRFLLLFCFITDRSVTKAGCSCGFDCIFLKNREDSCSVITPQACVSLSLKVPGPFFKPALSCWTMSSSHLSGQVPYHTRRLTELSAFCAFSFHLVRSLWQTISSIQSVSTSIDLTFHFLLKPKDLQFFFFVLF